MSDTPTSATSAPSAPAAAPAAPAAPTGQASTPARPHHAAAQPRTPEGKFNGPPDPAKAPAAGGTPAPEATATPPAPRWKVGDRDFTKPEDLAAYAAEKDAEARALDTIRAQAAAAAKRAAELEAKVKDPRKALTAEDRKALLQEEYEAWQESERIKAMPENERRFYLRAKELERKAAELEAREAERAAKEKEAADAAENERQQAEISAAREEMKVQINEALKMARLQPTALNVQHVATVMFGAAERGVVYPPEVIARKVRANVLAERQAEFKQTDPVALLTEHPELIDRLEALEDPALLRRLVKLGDRLRRLNLAEIGARPAAVPTPVATGASAHGGERQKFPPGDPRWQEERERRIRGG